MINGKPPVLVITGPTASGKSALAIEAALAFDGEIVNADSMQIYRELSVLSARPDEEDMAKVPHRLYGVLPGTERCSAGRWRDLALKEIAEIHATGRLPIVVGGTGLYIRALEQGIVEIPEIPEEVRREARETLADVGGEAFREKLAELDPEAAARLPSGDSQRLVRAWEVVKHTGRTLGEWQAAARAQAPDFAFVRSALVPPREELYDNCNRRFDLMLERGALDEVEALLALKLDPSLPVMKSLGVPELAEYLRGECDLETATSRAQQNTRRYAKRQMTWIRTQYASAYVMNEQYSKSLRDKFFNFVCRSGLTP